MSLIFETCSRTGIEIYFFFKELEQCWTSIGFLTYQTRLGIRAENWKCISGVSIFTKFRNCVQWYEYQGIKQINIREVLKYEYEYWFRVWCHTMNAIFIELIHWKWITTLQFEALRLKAKSHDTSRTKVYTPSTSDKIKLEVGDLKLTIKCIHICQLVASVNTT